MRPRAASTASRQCGSTTESAAAGCLEHRESSSPERGATRWSSPPDESPGAVRTPGRSPMTRGRPQSASIPSPGRPGSPRNAPRTWSTRTDALATSVSPRQRGPAPFEVWPPGSSCDGTSHANCRAAAGDTPGRLPNRQNPRGDRVSAEDRRPAAARSFAASPGTSSARPGRPRPARPGPRPSPGTTCLDEPPAPLLTESRDGSFP